METPTDIRALDTSEYQKEGPVARIVLNTPEKANIQTAQQVWEFDEALGWADRDEEVKVLVVKANGPGFCAGHAIVGPEEMGRVYPTTGPTPERTHKNHNQDLFLWPALRLWEFPKASIAQVHGYCLGGGTVYGLLPDLTIASDDAYFQMPLPQGFGLPGAQTMIEPWVLMNWKRTFEYLYLAPTLTAEEAMKWGFVNEVVPRDQLDRRVDEVARTVARMPLTTIMAIKTGVKRAWEGMGMRTHLQSSTDYITICSGATDVREFMARSSGQRPRQFAAGEGDVEKAPGRRPSRSATGPSGRSRCAPCPTRDAVPTTISTAASSHSLKKLCLFTTSKTAMTTPAAAGNRSGRRRTCLAARRTAPTVHRPTKAIPGTTPWRRPRA
jgi:enoyl-CoA hydratase